MAVCTLSYSIDPYALDYFCSSFFSVSMNGPILMPVEEGVIPRPYFDCPHCIDIGGYGFCYTTTPLKFSAAKELCSSIAIRLAEWNSTLERDAMATIPRAQTYYMGE